MPNSGNFEDEEPLVGQDPEQGFTNPNIPQNEIDAAMDNEDAASMISGQDGAMGAQEVMEKGAEGQSQPISETLKQATAVPAVLEKKADPKKEESGSALMSALIVVGFIAADCGKVLFENFAGTGHSTWNNASFLAFVSLINIALSFGATAFLGGKEGIKQAFSSSIMLFILPSAMFAGSQLMTILQNSEIKPDLRKVFQQLRIPMTAIFSKFVMGHGYTSMQWYLICMVVCCVFSFQIATNKSGVLFDTEGDNNIGMGLLLSILANTFACFGSLLAEKYCKDAAKTPFYIQKFQIELWTFLASLLNIFTLQMGVGWLGDAIFSDGKQRFEKNNVFNYKTMQFAHKPFASSRPWTTPELPTSKKTIQFGNMYDTASWESMWDQTMDFKMKDGTFVPSLVPNTFPADSFDEPQYQKLIALIQQIATVQQARREADADSDVASRAAGPLFKALIAGEKPLWKTIAGEGSFLVSHGFAPVQAQQGRADVQSQFGFTWGVHEKVGEKEMFVSKTPAQRPTPRLTSWWLQKNSGSHLFASKPEHYFTHKKNIAGSFASELAAAQKEKAFEMGDKAPLDSEQDGVEVTTYKRAALYDSKAKTMYLIFDEAKEKVWQTSTVKLSCGTPGLRLVLSLECDKKLDFADETDFAAKNTGNCKLGEPTWEAPADMKQKCTLSHKNYHSKDAKGQKEYDAKQKEIQAQKKKTEAAKKTASTEEKEKALRKTISEIIPIALKNPGQGVEESKFGAADSKAARWLDGSIYDFMPVPAKGEYQTYTYPGSVGAGANKGGSYVCDQYMCELPDSVWEKHYGYMSNHWLNRPQNPTGEATKNPFNWGQMHEWTRSTMPGAIWGRYVYLALLSNIGQSWLSGLLAKTLSSLWKNLCQAVALALVIIVQRATNEPTNVPKTIGLVGGPKWIETLVGMTTVLLIVWTFSQAPKAPKKH